MRFGSRSAGKTRERYQPSYDWQPSTWPLMLLNRGDSQSATQQASQDWSVPPVRIETYAGFHGSPAPLPGCDAPPTPSVCALLARFRSRQANYRYQPVRFVLVSLEAWRLRHDSPPRLFVRGPASRLGLRGVAANRVAVARLPGLPGQNGHDSPPR